MVEGLRRPSPMCIFYALHSIATESLPLTSFPPSLRQTSGIRKVMWKYVSVQVYLAGVALPVTIC